MTIQGPQALLEKLSSKATTLQNNTREKALAFVSAGVGCFAFTLLQSVGIITSFQENGFFDEKELIKKRFKNLTAVRAALLSLCLCKAIIKRNSSYFLTDLGIQLVNHVGLITMVFDGYGELMAKGVSIAFDEIQNPGKYLKGGSIAVSSIQFSEELDPIIVDVIKKLKIKGTICDVGCGSANHLLKLHNATSLPGLGLDSSLEAVKIAKKATKKYPAIKIELANALNLEKVWDDVELLMQSFMTHDLFPDNHFVNSLKAYHKNFPNLKYFLIVDIVAPEDSLVSHMPAFDYVHGLLGIETRKHERFTSLFSKAGYKIVKEISVDMPNTYLWVLKPNH